MNPQVFREYDVRGVVDRDLDRDFVIQLGQSIGTYASAKKVKVMTIGRDCRLSSDAFHRYLTEGINAAGIDTIDIGLCATPMLYFSIRHLNTGGGVMVTGSHNPPEFNGFKICIGHDSIHGESIQDLRRIMEAKSYTVGAGSNRFQEITEIYTNYLFDHVKIHKPFKIVLDAGNGVGGKFAVPLLRRMGCEVTCLHCEPDGRFPNHFPDPTVEENLTDLISLVNEKKADLGIAFDGDADRIGVISDTGEIVWGDKLLLLFARAILKIHPGASIIGEVKCSQVLYDDIQKNGGLPIMWKAGHSLIKAKMKEIRAALGGEMSGHLFFADRYFGYDDAIYAAIRLLEILSDTGLKMSELLSDVPHTFATPEIRMDCADDQKKSVVEKIKHHYRNRPDVIDIDGVRIPFKDGWALVRCSNTQPVVVLRFEASSEESLRTMRAEVEGLLSA
ncbi:MAG: phosphomannomutase/phosphoglucomutase [Smithellaceae bacterium]